ncbi:LytR/AlgR family response regulator transcription factor [Desertivirga arenae]|uniref:LytR/AlgR family response regulator transcription factor n=1 Tax=Desertivirga arenae TaxID=2810309 RepID=UPI001A96FC77|nr:LytTR family DNA-binding domain-containing protein [Pedobacter sp. SYSU D00823]
MRVLIFEDEPLAAERLVKLLNEYNREVQVMAIIPSVEEAAEWLLANVLPDLILTDIHLADGLCFDIFKKAKVKCPVIFCTAYEEYALKAFQYHSIDYLLKPVKYSMLEQSLQKLEEMKGSARPLTEPKIDGFISMMNARNITYKSRFMVKLGAKIKAIKVEEIAYFYSHDKLNLLVTRDGYQYPVDYSLEELIQLLDPTWFFHVNRKLIIHIDSAKEIHPYFKGRLKLVLEPGLNEEVIVSSQRTPLFKAWLDQ